MRLIAHRVVRECHAHMPSGFPFSWVIFERAGGEERDRERGEISKDRLCLLYEKHYVRNKTPIFVLPPPTATSFSMMQRRQNISSPLFADLTSLLTKHGRRRGDSPKHFIIVLCYFSRRDFPSPTHIILCHEA